MQISPEELKPLLDAGKVKLIDVREQWEYDICHIKNSILIPLQELPSRIDELKKEDNVVLYCHTQNRSALAAQFMLSQGFRSVKFLRGGIDEWAEKIETSMARY